MNVKEINSAIMFGNLTNDELSTVIDAVKFVAPVTVPPLKGK